MKKTYCEPSIDLLQVADVIAASGDLSLIETGDGYIDIVKW